MGNQSKDRNAGTHKQYRLEHALVFPLLFPISRYAAIGRSSRRSVHYRCYPGEGSIGYD